MKYTTFTLYKSAKHKADMNAYIRKRLAQKLRDERTARKIIKGIHEHTA